SLSERIDRDQSGDEFDRLSARLNDMLERNEQLMTGMRLVTDSMAHDLKGPLTRLKARIELALRNPPNAGDDRAALEEILGESERALGLFDGLIKIAEAESGISRADFSTLDLCDLVPGLVELYEPVAEERFLSLRCDLPASLPVFGHAELLSQSLANLLDNAIKYVPAGGEIGVTGHLSPDGSMISVSDNGPGVPEADRDRIIGRFARLDKARSTPGSGLGLSLVSAVAKLHGARLVLEDNNPGLVVRITYPPPEQGTGKP
ncbi:MAG: HAMP domain-containing sensor histidine kinase, partial [Pseudomonadota bacterium]